MARYVIFPGTAGSYADTADVNLLDCDSSWFAQGTGGLWTVGVPSGDQSVGDSPFSLLVAGGVSTAITPVTDAAFFALKVYSAAGDTFDINGGTPVVVSAGVWTEIKATGNAGTYTVNAAGAGDYYLAEVIVQATDVPFVPSLRIVGDLDIRGDIVPDVWPVATNTQIVSKYVSAANGMYYVQFRTSGAMRLLRVIGGAADSADSFASVDMSFRSTWQVTHVLSTDAVVFTVNDVINRTTSISDGVPDSVAGDLNVGANAAGTGELFTGDVYTVEVRDGIDGPIVAIFDAEDIGL